MASLQHLQGSPVYRLQESAVIIVEGGEYRDVPIPFLFPPHYTAAIEVGLRLKYLQSLQQAQFLYKNSKCNAAIQALSTKADYLSVAREIVQKYPFLKSPLDPIVSEHIRSKVNTPY